MLKIKSLGLLFILVFLGACVEKSYTKQEEVFLIFKTKQFKYADLGFLYESREGLKIEMYSNAQALMTLEVNSAEVCLSRFECLDKEVFNAKVFSAFYPKDILSHILKGKMLFHGQNRETIKNGFRQNISKKGKYTISYSVIGKEIIFIDTFNNINIKMKRL
jgi:hypothetical protein